MCTIVLANVVSIALHWPKCNGVTENSIDFVRRCVDGGEK
jgi:hypothetical protein